MRLDQVHLLANTLVGIVVGIAIGVIIWKYLPVAWWIKFIAIFLDLVFAAYVAHRITPYLTNSIVEKGWVIWHSKCE
jgi:hypothetical protein